MKTLKEHLKEKHGNKFQDCDFGIKQMNLHKRKLSVQEAAGANKPTTSGRGKPPKGGGTGGGGSTPASGAVIFLDFTGTIITNTSWNYYGDIFATPANLTALQVDEIVANTVNEFAPYGVTVTTDEAIYNVATKKTRIILTESYEWYGNGAGGVAFVGSFDWNDGTPCWVFTSLLNYSTKKIKEAATHELGHTLGLYHQSTYDANCVKTSDYNFGDGITCPIMGVGYYTPDAGTKWWIGPNSYGCNQIQDDNAILTQKLGLK